MNTNWLHRWTACVLVVLGLMMGSGPASGQTQEPNLRVGVYHLPPQVFLTEGNNIGGIFGELLTEIAKLEGWRIEPVHCHWQQCLDLLKADRIDLLPDVVYTPDRARFIQFQGTPILETWAQVYAAPGTDIGSFPQLASKRIAMLAGSAQYDYLASELSNRELTANITTVEDTLQAFQAYAAGKVDVVITDFFFGKKTAATHGLTAMPLLFMPSWRHFAAPMDANPAILDTIDTYVKRWRANQSSVYYRILARWEASNRQPATPWYRHWSAPVLAGLMFIGLLAMVAFRQHQRKLLRRTDYLEQHDNLTGLPNRQVLTSRLEQVLQIAMTDKRHFSALLKINLDGFKRVNDTGGHAAGDHLLQATADCLLAHTRERDTVSRLGADEFMVLLVQVGKTRAQAANNAMRVAKKLNYQLANLCIPVNNVDYHARASFGLTLLNDGMDDADTLMYQADLAMQQAKASGGENAVFYNASIQQEVQKRMQLEQDLFKAIGTSQLRMVVQPQIDRHGDTVGAELLMRWDHPEEGIVAPDVFIPLAEETGFIHELTRWSVTVACDLANELQDRQLPYTLSVNISPKCIRSTDFAVFVEETLKQTGVPGHRLIFEVTEGVWIQNIEHVRSAMLAFTEMGIQFAMDDFGSGYANLAYLKHLPLSELKIDKSLVHGIPDDSNSTAISNFIILLGQQLNMRVVTEGVETRTQSLFLYSRGCNAQQGYLHARPMPIPDWLISVTPARSRPDSGTRQAL